MSFTDKSNVLCTDCEKSGHPADECFLTHPYLLTNYLSRHPGTKTYWEGLVRNHKAKEARIRFKVALVVEHNYFFLRPQVG
jgi:hypothetical protein